jgi:hypothetical protein
MATNKPIGDNARKGAVRKPTQLKTKVKGGRPLDQAGQGHRGTHGPEEDGEKAQGRASGEIGRHSFARVLLIAPLLLLIPIVGHAISLAPEESAKHVGETATVCGMVASVNYALSAPMAPTFIDLGQPYPNEVFTVIIFEVDRQKFGSPEISMQGKSICVTGEIFLYQGKPRMTLRDPRQLTAQ